MTRFQTCLCALALLPACGRAKLTDIPDGGAVGEDGATAEASASELGPPEGGAAEVGAAGRDGDSGEAAGTDAADADAAATDAADAGAAGADAAGTDAADADAAGADDPPERGSPLRVLALSTGIYDTCVLLDNHRVKCWGANSYGSLGTGDRENRGAPEEMGDALPYVDLGTGRTATAIASGRYHSCAILDDGGVKCWGYRPMTGQPPGDGEAGIGDDPGEMGDALPPLDLGGHKATHVGCGYFMSCVALDDGSVRCWSSESSLARTPTAVALGSTSKVRQLAQANGGVVALFEDGTVSGSLLPPAPGFTATRKATYLAGSWTGACAVVEGGGVECRSSSSQSVAALETTPDLVAFGVGINSLRCGLSRSGDVRCWGGTSCDSPAPGTVYWCPEPRRPDMSVAVPLGGKAIAIGSGGQEHQCALLADGGVKCWKAVDWCPGPPGNGDVLCAVPLQPDLMLGGSIDVVGTGASRRWGEWRTVNLGTHQ